MPITPTYPGVYIEELPSGVRTIAGVATSVTAFVGRARRGPVDTAVTVDNFGDYERVFGGLWLQSSLGYAVRDFFMNGGGQAVVVRVFCAGGEPDVARLQLPAVRTFTVQEHVFALQEAVPGVWDTMADLRVRVDAVAGSSDRFTLKVWSRPPAPAGGGAQPDGTEEVLTVNLASAWTDLARSALVRLSGPLTALPDATRAPARDTDWWAAAASSKVLPPATAEERTRLAAGSMTLVAASPGAWGNRLRARVERDVSPEVALRYGLDVSAMFNLLVRDPETGTVEVFRNVTLTGEGPRALGRVLDQGSRLVRLLPGGQGVPGTPNGSGSKPWWEDPQASAGVTVPASDGAAPGENDVLPADGRSGLYALEKTDVVNLVCIPPLTPGQGNADTLWSRAAAWCEARRAMLVVDASPTWAADTAASAELPVSSRNAALFYPWLRAPNPLRENQIEDFAPCGAVAGVIARTDTQRGIWKAPAGLDATLTGTVGLKTALTDAEIGRLNPRGINCLRTMPAAGRVIWGARTTQGADRLASEWKYLPVRRLALYIEESLYRGTQWAVFEPNDEPLWGQIRLAVGAFMNGLFRQGAFQGASPKDAWFVKCDRETTTQTDINLGIVNVVVGFAPLKPAEFVIVKLQQMAGQAAA